MSSYEIFKEFIRRIDKLGVINVDYFYEMIPEIELDIKKFYLNMVNYPQISFLGNTHNPALYFLSESTVRKIARILSLEDRCLSGFIYRTAFNKKNKRKNSKFSSYLINDSYCRELAHDIGTFTQKEEFYNLIYQSYNMTNDQLIFHVCTMSRQLHAKFVKEGYFCIED
jgi:hypothetical protein